MSFHEELRDQLLEHKSRSSAPLVVYDPHYLSISSGVRFGSYLWCGLPSR